MIAETLVATYRSGAIRGPSRLSRYTLYIALRGLLVSRWIALAALRFCGLAGFYEYVGVANHSVVAGSARQADQNSE